MKTHYEVLGVPRSASTRQIREAFRAKARLLHPDRLIDASPRERTEAARELQVVTDAWKVLGDGRRRRAYDESLEPSGSRHYADTTLGDDLVDAGPAGTAPLLRGLPWLILAAVLLLIFVFTAYAGPNGDDPTPGGSATSVAASVEVGDCVDVQGDVVVAVSCDGGNDGQVVAAVPAASGVCPPDTQPVVTPRDNRILCLAR